MNARLEPGNLGSKPTCTGIFGAPYEGVSKNFRTGRLERELQMVQLSATRCSWISILWVSLVSFAAITLYVASERVIPKLSVYFVIDSVRKPLDTPSCVLRCLGLPTERLRISYRRIHRIHVFGRKRNGRCHSVISWLLKVKKVALVQTDNQCLFSVMCHYFSYHAF
jgi:hypothetical protein